MDEGVGCSGTIEVIIATMVTHIIRLHHSLLHHALLRSHVVEVGLWVVHWQVLNPVLLLVGHVMVHMGPRRQGDNTLLDQTGGRRVLDFGGAISEGG